MATSPNGEGAAGVDVEDDILLAGVVVFLIAIGDDRGCLADRFKVAPMRLCISLGRMSPPASWMFVSSGPEWQGFSARWEIE